MHFSKILIKSLALCLSTCSIAAADSPQLSRALDDLSTLSEGIQSATNSINFYQGGALPAIPAGKKFYNVWNTLQKATAGLGNESDLSPEDSRELIDEVENMRPIVQKGMEASGSKVCLSVRTSDAPGPRFCTSLANNTFEMLSCPLWTRPELASSRLPFTRV